MRSFDPAGPADRTPRSEGAPFEAPLRSGEPQPPARPSATSGARPAEPGARPPPAAADSPPTAGDGDGDRDRPEPDIRRLLSALEKRVAIRSVALTVLALLALLYTLYFARGVVLPVVLAVVLSFVTAPPVRGLRKLGIPDAIGAAIVVVGLVAAVVVLAYTLTGPANEWFAKAPESLEVIGHKLRDLRKPIEKVSQATEQVEKITDQVAGDTGAGKAPEVVVKKESLAGTLLSQTQKIALGAVTLFILLYFLLASGDLFLRKVVNVLPTFGDKKRAVEVARTIESEVSRYLATVTTINVCLGIAVGIAMWLHGMPNPMLWGAMVAMFNFIPFLGDVGSFTIITIVALLTYDDVWRALTVPLTFYALTALEGYLITPMILGKRLTLNPVVIFVSILLWGAIWGIAGAVLAVPMLVVIKALCDNIEPLRAVGEFLTGEAPDGERGS